MTEVIELLGLALIGSLIALVGGIVFLYNERWSKVLERHSVPFAAGVLLTVALIGLMPEALELSGESTFRIILFSFLAAYIFEHTLFGLHHHGSHQHGKDYGSAIPLVIIGDTIHNFIDGVAIAASFFVSPGLGLITAISTLLHEVPHEIGDFGILLKAGWARKKVLMVNIISASFTIVGAFFVYFMSDDPNLIGTLLAVSAGLFLYLGASDFLPHIEEEEHGPIKSLLPLVIGVAIMLFTLSIIPHRHEDTSGGQDVNRQIHSDFDQH